MLSEEKKSFHRLSTITMRVVDKIGQLIIATFRSRGPKLIACLKTHPIRVVLPRPRHRRAGQKKTHGSWYG